MSSSMGSSGSGRGSALTAAAGPVDSSASCSGDLAHMYNLQKSSVADAQDISWLSAVKLDMRELWWKKS